MGAIVFCRLREEKIIFNHEELFLRTNKLRSFPDMSDVFKEVRKMVKENKGPEAAELFYNKAKERGMDNTFIKDETLYPDSFFPAFELNIAYDAKASDYERYLNTYNGEIVMSCSDNDKKIIQRVFTSIVDNAVCISLTGGKNHKINISLPVAQDNFEKELLDKCIISENISFENNVLLYDIIMNEGRYQGRIEIRSDGDVGFSDNKIQISNADVLELFVTIGIDKNAEIIDFSDYNAMFDENIKFYHKDFFSSEIIFSSGAKDSEYTQDLFSDLDDPDSKTALMQKLYYMGRYLAVSSFGKIPPNSQGLWNARVNGRTFCDYVTNIEFEMAIWCVLGGNFIDKANSVFNFIERYMGDFEENAKKIFGMKGIVITSRMTDSGLLFHFGPGYAHEFWIAAAAWIALFYYEYWQYTKDMDFLRTKALPFMQKAADFYCDYVDKNGEVIPSVSPENSPYEKIFCMAGKNSVMDISSIRELFKNLERVCRILKVENKHKIILCDYFYEEDGSLKEWADENACTAYAHRHISHLYPIMYGNEAKNDNKLKRGIAAAIDKRIENGFFTEDNGTCGWSVMQLLNAYIRLGDKDGVRRSLDFLLSHYINKNLTACLNYSTTVFQIDVNLGYLNAVYEMLVDTEEDKLMLLRCVSEELNSGKAFNIPLKNKKIIKKLIWNEKNIEVDIFSEDAGNLTVISENDVKYLKFTGNQSIKTIMNR